MECTRTPGHMLLIYGYVMIDSDYWFLIRDPAPENEGKSYMATYQQIYHGPSFHNGNNDIYTWDRCLIRDTGVTFSTQRSYYAD